MLKVPRRDSLKPSINAVHQQNPIEAMTQQAIFTNFEHKHGSMLWGNQPILLQHRLHQSPLFSRETLASLIETYPREHYNIFSMGAKTNDTWYWRQGDFKGLSGEEVISAISNGRLWLNLRKANVVDRRYGDMLDGMFEELAGRIPGFSSLRHECGILISSPGAQVYYHVDLGGQMLFQIMGRKRLLFYPAAEPFITGESLERTAISTLAVDVPYADWYDEYAKVYEFEPGQMVHWPLFAPHRVENHDSLNVSLTVEFSTSSMRRAQIINLANGALRARFGWTPRSRAVTGPSFWAKAGMWAALRKTSWLKKTRAANAKIEFQLDRTVPGRILDVTAA